MFRAWFTAFSVGTVFVNPWLEVDNDAMRSLEFGWLNRK